MTIRWDDPSALASGAAVAALLLTRAVGRRRVRRSRPVIDTAQLVGRSRPAGHRRMVTMIALTSAVAVIAGPFVAVIVIAVWATVRAWRSARVRRSSTVEARRQLPDAVDVIVLGIRAGLTPAIAFAELAQALPPQLAGYFAEVSVLHRHGERFADALTALHAAPDGMLRPLATTLARAERYGEPLAPVLDRLADEARRERRRQSETSARQLPVRMCFPLACCALPAFVVLTIVPLLAGTFTSIRGNLP